MTTSFDPNFAPPGCVAAPAHGCRSKDDYSVVCALKGNPDECDSAKCSRFDRPDRTNAIFIKARIMATISNPCGSLGEEVSA